MSEKERINEEDIITLEFEDISLECEIMGIFEHGDKEYMALIPQDDTDDIYIYEYKELSDDEDGVEFELKDIEDDEEFEAVVQEFDAIMAEGVEPEELN